VPVPIRKEAPFPTGGPREGMRRMPGQEKVVSLDRACAPGGGQLRYGGIAAARQRQRRGVGFLAHPGSLGAGGHGQSRRRGHEPGREMARPAKSRPFHAKRTIQTKMAGLSTGVGGETISMR